MMNRLRGKNLAVKFLAVVLAVVLWIYVTNEQNPPVETTITVPLEVRNVASPLVAVDAPDSVRIKVRGSRNVIAGLQPKDIDAYLDLRGVAEGRHTTKVSTQAPSGLELLEVSPDRVPFRMDTLVSRKLPVEIKLTGTVAGEVSVAKVSFTPEQVSVEGPRAAVESIGKVLLAVDLTGKTGDFTAEAVPAPVSKDGKELDGLTVNPEKVLVAVNMVRGANRKMVDVKTTVYGELAPGLVLSSIATDPDRIEISGDPQALSKIEFVYTEPVSIAGIDRDTAKDAKLQLGDGLESLRNSVTVRISVKDSR